MNHRRRLVPALAAAAALLMATAGRAQQPPRLSEPEARRPHLIGHEDAELLRRIQQVIDDHDPRKLRNPYIETVEEGDPANRRWARHALRRADLTEFIADVDAAMALGKAFFWEMQAGSDFGRRRGEDGRDRYRGVACASCHFRFGADPRDTGSRRIPYVAWDRYPLDRDHKDLGFGEVQQKVDAAAVASHRVGSIAELLEKPRPGFPPHERRRPPGLGADEEEEKEDEDGDDEDDRPRTPLSLIIGSQGVTPRVFKSLVVGNAPAPGPEWDSERSEPRDPRDFHRPPEWSMFLADPLDPSSGMFRQITSRNTPTVINAAFADRLFHDVRAESTFNGFSIFGDHDPHEPVIHVRRLRPDGKPGLPAPVHVAIPHAALASQAVGPIVNDVEMSYVGRTFHDIAGKLLDAPVLGYQRVAADDSILGRYRSCDLPPDANGLGGSTTYRGLIRQAFRREWWDGTDEHGREQPVLLNLAIVVPGQMRPTGTLMDANFSLYWGLSILLYEASLVSNQSPHDAMLRGRGEDVDRLWERVRTQLEPIHLDRVHNPARRPGAGAVAPGRKPDEAAPTPADAPFPFALRSGAEVYQRGLRAFLNRGCVECHVGPLFSEIYEREDAQEVEVDRTIPIARLVRNALLPVSRGDALAHAYLSAQEDVYRRILGLVARAGAPKPFARRELQDMARLFERLGGDEAALAHELEDLLRAIQPSPADPAKLASRIARAWTTFEKTFPLRLGRRPFFNEEERLATARLITEPLLVEWMAVPPTRAGVRPPWPIPGPRAADPYFFYDASVYTLGAGLPRYDRGVGDWRRLDAKPHAPANPPGVLAEIDGWLRELPLAQAATSNSRRNEMKRLNDALVRKYGVVVSEEFRRRFYLLVRPADAAGVPAEREKLRKDLPAPDDPSRIAPRFVSVARLAENPGVSGRAYRLDVRTTQGGLTPNLKTVAETFRPRTPGDEVHGPWAVASDADADDRASRPRDLSWRRNLPNWNRSPDLEGGQGGFDSLDGRRDEVHFFSRARRLVQTESSEGRRKPLLHDDELGFWGSFKTPTLRNVALTPPYMHNGRIQSLFDVMDFYDRGGDVPPDRERNPDIAPAMARLGMTEEDKLAVVFFLMCLSDPRVERDAAPFDHPSLTVVNGCKQVDGKLVESAFEVKAVGAGGRSGAPHPFPSNDDSEHPPLLSSPAVKP